MKRLLEKGDLVKLTAVDFNMRARPKNNNFNKESVGYVIQEEHPEDTDELAILNGNVTYIGRVKVKWAEYTPDEEWVYSNSLIKLA